MGAQAVSLVTGPLLATPGFSVDTIRLCSMHTFCLGLLQTANGSSLTFASKSFSRFSVSAHLFKRSLVYVTLEFSLDTQLLAKDQPYRARVLWES